MDGEPPARAGAPEGYALAYEKAKRALEEQERVVAELRSRAGILIGAAAITTSFFAGRILGRQLHSGRGPLVGCSSAGARPTPAETFALRWESGTSRRPASRPDPVEGKLS